MDTDLLNKMKKANEEELKRLDNELEDAEKILGESEIRDAMMAKAEYLCRIGDKVGDTEALWTRRNTVWEPCGAGPSECWGTCRAFSLWHSSHKAGREGRVLLKYKLSGKKQFLKENSFFS